MKDYRIVRDECTVDVKTTGNMIDVVVMESDGHIVRIGSKALALLLKALRKAGECRVLKHGTEVAELKRQLEFERKVSHRLSVRVGKYKRKYGELI